MFTRGLVWGRERLVVFLRGCLRMANKTVKRQIEEERPPQCTVTEQKNSWCCASVNKTEFLFPFGRVLSWLRGKMISRPLALHPPSFTYPKCQQMNNKKQACVVILTHVDPVTLLAVIKTGPRSEIFDKRIATNNCEH